MDVIIEDYLQYRYKKKWVNRYCKLVKTNNFSDSVKLLICTSDEGKSIRTSLIAKKPFQTMSKHVVYGHLHGIHLNNQTHVMFVVCKNSVECLAFRSFDNMKTWSDHLASHLNDISQPVTLIYADKNSQIRPKLEGRLLINYSHISFIRDPSNPEPKLLMSWKISDIMEYGCSKDMKKNSTKRKTKSTQFESTDNLFILKASPLFYLAPNYHIFSCHSPKQFCDRLEYISNQENLNSPNDSEGLMQKSRTESYFVFHDYKDGDMGSSDLDLSPDSATTSNRFFSEPTQQRSVPKFQRSNSEAPQRRNRMDSGYSIDEDKELELNERNVTALCQGTDLSCISDIESPVRSSTFTLLERYPFENEPQKTSRSRHTSAMYNGSYRTLFNNSCNTEQRPIRPKSSSNYCSLENLRMKSKSSPDSPPFSNNFESPLPMLKESLSLHLDKSQGLISRRSMKLTDGITILPGTDKSSSGYANLEFNEIFEQINKFCTSDTDLEKHLKR